MGAALFRHRLAVIVGFFGAAAVTAFALARVSDKAALLEPLGARAFLVTGLLCLVAFVLRASGEARLGSAVYGQEAAPRVVTSGPFRVMRHPLYAGTWLFFAAGAAPWLPLVALLPLALAFGACLAAIAAHEEGALLAAHGDAWTRYAKAVPRFIGVPGPVDADAIVTTSKAWGAAVLANLGFLSLGVYRILTALDVGFRGLASLNLLCLAVWIGVVVVRRFRRG